MRTGEIAEPLPGNKLYQQRAMRAFPILVRQAFANQPISYSDLGDELGMPNPRNLNFVLGSIGQTVQNLAEEWSEEIPPITCLVINKKEGLPSGGVAWFIDDTHAFDKMPLKQRRAIVGIELQKIFAYPRWLDVLRSIGLKYEPAKDYSPLAKEVQQRRGKGESEHHKQFKEYVSRNPQILKLPKSIGPGLIEYPLPSGDIVDVLFKGQTDWVAAETKSRISDTADIYRGLYQCVKYRAVVEAYQSELGNLPSCRAVLVVEGKFPESLTELKNILGAEVVDNVSLCGQSLPSVLTISQAP
jgi:hypothetical protein